MAKVNGIDQKYERSGKNRSEGAESVCIFGSRQYCRIRTLLETGIGPEGKESENQYMSGMSALSGAQRRGCGPAIDRRSCDPEGDRIGIAASAGGVRSSGAAAVSGAENTGSCVSPYGM